MFSSTKNCIFGNQSDLFNQYQQQQQNQCYYNFDQPQAFQAHYPQQQQQQQTNNGHHHQKSSVSTAYDFGYYNNINHNPIAPSLRPVQQEQQEQQEQPSTGGVSSVLDYDMNQMVKFVSWVTFGLMKRTINPSKGFLNTITSVLSATRLPKSTLILALHYLSSKMDNNFDPILNENVIFQNLTVSLVLANKFNDDNTFKNKSWSDATGLSLNLINNLEREWLLSCSWELHQDSSYSMVESCWNTWCLRYNNPNIQNSENAISNPYCDSSSMAPPMENQNHTLQSSPIFEKSPSTSLFSEKSQFSPIQNYISIDSSPFFDEFNPFPQYQNNSIPVIPPPPPPASLLINNNTITNNSNINNNTNNGNSQIFENPFQQQQRQQQLFNDYYDIYKNYMLKDQNLNTMNFGFPNNYNVNYYNNYNNNNNNYNNNNIYYCTATAC